MKDDGVNAIYLYKLNPWSQGIGNGFQDLIGERWGRRWTIGLVHYKATQRFWWTKIILTQWHFIICLELKMHDLDGGIKL